MVGRMWSCGSPQIGVAVVGLLLGACAPPSSEEGATGGDVDLLRSSLIDADRAFNRATQDAGAEGWVSFFDPEGAMIQPGIGEIAGLDAIRSAMSESLSTEGVSLTWEPDRAHVSDDGSLGFTVGHYEFASPGVDQVGKGLYVSIWRRQPDRSWKVIMDLGNPTS